MACKRFEGRAVLITASTAGIGLAIAERLAQEGASVYISSRKQQNVEETVKYLQSKGLRVEGCACNVGNAEQRKQLVAAAVKAFGRIDVLISNATVNPYAGPLAEIPPDAIDKILDVNIKAPVMLVREALPHMSRGSCIVFNSSITAFSPQPPISMYAISKTALLGLTKALSAELGPQGIRVNCVAPGIVPTKFAAYLVQTPELAKQQADATSLRRLGTPEDIAGAVAFLASGDADWLTGETLVVSGGTQSRL